MLSWAESERLTVEERSEDEIVVTIGGKRLPALCRDSAIKVMSALRRTCRAQYAGDYTEVDAIYTKRGDEIGVMPSGEGCEIFFDVRRRDGKVFLKKEPLTIEDAEYLAGTLETLTREPYEI